MVSKPSWLPECGRYARTSPRHKARARTQRRGLSRLRRKCHYLRHLARHPPLRTRPSGAFAACCASTASTGSNTIGLSATIARSCDALFAALFGSQSSESASSQSAVSTSSLSGSQGAASVSSFRRFYFLILSIFFFQK